MHTIKKEDNYDIYKASYRVALTCMTKKARRQATKLEECMQIGRIHTTDKANQSNSLRENLQPQKQEITHASTKKIRKQGPINRARKMSGREATQQQEYRQLRKY